jgi:hypothetical protein
MTDVFSWTPDPASAGSQQRFVAGEWPDVSSWPNAASGPRLALCLHGFPELNFSWRHQMPLLAQKGLARLGTQSARLWCILQAPKACGPMLSTI